MGTIYVHGPQSMRQTALVNEWRNGIYRIAYMGEGEYGVPITKHVDPYHVAEVIERMQQYVPLGALGDYHVFCSDLQLGSPFNGSWGGNALYDGERFNGWLVLSGVLTRPAWDIVTHEVAHEIDKTLLSETDRDTIHGIIGIPKLPNVSPTPWAERSQEVIAEYLTLVLFAQPLHEDMWRRWGYPSYQVGENMTAWARQRFTGMPKAMVEVDPDMLEVSVTEGSNTATVNGAPEMLVPGYPEAVAETRNGFFSLPMAAVTRWSGGTKAWDEQTRTGTFRIPKAR